MKKQFETRLASDFEQIDGVAYQKNTDGSAWEFKSIDGSVHLIIAKDENGHWQRIGGTEPYLSSWTGELAGDISKNI